ncbi:MAG: hypothetical protein DRO11_03240 [Methanobacteriota archaeon]|nr:MAG: hypothetical protein DRO11_03240 [Euryarchaeota archaeon]
MRIFKHNFFILKTCLYPQTIVFSALETCYAPLSNPPTPKGLNKEVGTRFSTWLLGENSQDYHEPEEEDLCIKLWERYSPLCW